MYACICMLNMLYTKYTFRFTLKYDKDNICNCIVSISYSVQSTQKKKMSINSENMALARILTPVPGD